MRKLFSITILLLFIIGLTSCAFLKSLRKPKAQTGKPAGIAVLPEYSGAKARIAVTDFEVKTDKATTTIGSGLREMLVTALINSNRFSVVERQALSAQAGLIISVALTEFEPQASGGSAGVGGGGSVGSGAMGGLLGSSLNKAHIMLDLRIIDAASSKILAATKVQGQAADVTGSIMNGPGSWSLDQEFSLYTNTPMEKAIRRCILEAVQYISQKIPATYYKFAQ